MITVAYGVIVALSFLMTVGCYLFERKKKRETWLLVLYASVFVANLGYLLLSLAKSLDFALAANKIAYLGQAFVPLCMFMIISGLLGFVYKKWVKYALIGAATLMFALVLTTGHLDWYYKSVELTVVDGAAKLVKEYGPLHLINLLYVLAYFVAMLIVICISFKKSRVESKKPAGLMLAVVFGNILMWIIEKFIPLNFEFLSVSYLMSEFVFFFVYWMLDDYTRKSEAAAEGKAPVIVVDSLTRAERLEAIVKSLPEDKTLSARQLDILELILDGKSRKEIAAALHLSENTVKTHTAALYKTLEVSGRSEIYAKFR